MADQNKKEQAEDIKKEIPASEHGHHFEAENALATEKKEIPPGEEIIAQELKRELELMEADENVKAEAEKARQKIDFLGEQEKIEHLLQIAREKGLVFAIGVARKMNEPFLLDVLHDTLAREGFYKDFLSKKKSVDDN